MILYLTEIWESKISHGIKVHFSSLKSDQGIFHVLACINMDYFIATHIDSMCDLLNLGGSMRLFRVAIWTWKNLHITVIEASYYVELIWF